MRKWRNSELLETRRSRGWGEGINWSSYKQPSRPAIADEWSTERAQKQLTGECHGVSLQKTKVEERNKASTRREPPRGVSALWPGERIWSRDSLATMPWRSLMGGVNLWLLMGVAGLLILIINTPLVGVVFSPIHTHTFFWGVAVAWRCAG